MTYEFPCMFSETDNYWISFDRAIILIDAVVAYYPIQRPKGYNTIGYGNGFYIRTDAGNKNESIYGFRLEPICWSNIGYKTKELAIAAMKRLKKLDEKDGLVRQKYEVINSEKESIYILK